MNLSIIIVYLKVTTQTPMCDAIKILIISRCFLKKKKNNVFIAWKITM